MRSFKQIAQQLPRMIQNGGQIVVKSLKMYREIVKRFGKNIPIVLRRTIIKQKRQCGRFCSPRRIIIRRRIRDPLMKRRRRLPPPRTIVKKVYVPKPVYIPSPSESESPVKNYILHSDKIVVKCSHPVDPKIVAQNYKPLPPPVNKGLDMVIHDEAVNKATTTSTAATSISTVIQNAQLEEAKDKELLAKAQEVLQQKNPSSIIEKFSKECDQKLKKEKKQEKQTKSQQKQAKSQEKQTKLKKEQTKNKQNKATVQYRLPKRTDPLVAKTIQRSLDLKQLVKQFKKQGTQGKVLKQNIISIAQTSREAAKIHQKVHKHHGHFVKGKKSFDDLLQYIQGVVSKGANKLRNKRRPHARKMFSTLNKLTQRMERGRVDVHDFLNVVKSYKRILPQRRNRRGDGVQRKSRGNRRRGAKPTKRQDRRRPLSEEEDDDDDEEYSFL